MKPTDAWYWPGWTSKLMGETPHPNQQIPATSVFENLENVNVFVYCQQYTSGTYTIDRVDCFYLMDPVPNGTEYHHYLPYMYSHI